MADKYAKQREFEAWLAEVKKAPGVANGAQWEVVQHTTCRHLFSEERSSGRALFEELLTRRDWLE